MKDEAETAKPRRTRTRKGGDKPAAAPRAAGRRRGVSTPATDADAAVTGTEAGSEATTLEATGTPVIPLRRGDGGDIGGALDADASDRDPATAVIAALHGGDGGGTLIIPLRPSMGGEAGGVSSGPAAAEAAETHVLESVPHTDATADVQAVAGSRTAPGGDGTTCSIRPVAEHQAGSAPASLDAGALDPGEHAATSTLPLPVGPDRPDIPRPNPRTRAGDAGDTSTGGFKERALRTARIKFADDRVRSPLTSQQLDVLTTSFTSRERTARSSAPRGRTWSAACRTPTRPSPSTSFAARSGATGPPHEPAHDPSDAVSECTRTDFDRPTRVVRAAAGACPSTTAVAAADRRGSACAGRRRRAPAAGTDLVPTAPCPLVPPDQGVHLHHPQRPPRSMHTDRYDETHEALATGEGMREPPEPDSRAPAEPEEDVVVQA